MWLTDVTLPQVFEAVLVEWVERFYPRLALGFNFDEVFALFARPWKLCENIGNGVLGYRCCHHG